MADFTKADLAFIAQAKRIEKASERVHGWAVIDPTKPAKRPGVVRIADRGACRAVAWLPGADDSIRHHGTANGGGYDRQTAAMGGARFIAPDGAEYVIKDEGCCWYNQLRDAGFVVVQVI